MENRAQPRFPSHAARNAAVRPRRRRSRRRGFLAGLLENPLTWLLVAAAGLLVLIIILLSPYFYYQFSQRIVPGVQIGSSAVGGLSVPEAVEMIQADWNTGRQIIASEGLANYTVPMEQVGLRVDAEATARAAYAIGHGQGIVAEIRQMLASWRDGWQIAPVVAFNEPVARGGLQSLSEQISKPAQDASFYIQNGELIAVEPELGYAINIDETLSNLAADPTGVLVSGYLKLQLKPVPPSVTDVSGLMAEAESLLAAPPQIIAYDPIYNDQQNWTVSREQMAEWLRVEPGPTSARIGIDVQKVTATLQSLSADLDGDRLLNAADNAPVVAEAALNRRPATILIGHTPTDYTVKPGDTLLKIAWRTGMPVWRILKANPGQDPDKIVAGQTLIIPSKDDQLPLPIVMGKRIVIDIGKQRLRVYENGELRSKHVISTGMDRSPTQPGVFQVQTHELSAYASVWDLTMPHFIGIYEAWPGFMNGIHGLPTLSNGQRLWENILGRPASYGCIILDLKTAEWLYNWAEAGVVVEIVP